ncbi:MAG: GGDEF domain-containing protein, partial [Actinomycetota bacterium]
DLDDFKRINDTMGHEAGDRVLTAVADSLRLAMRTGDEVGRWGGDEFVLVAPKVQSAADARGIGERILTLLADDLLLPDGTTIGCSLSIGVAWTRSAGEGVQGLLACADAALYEAKLAGKRSVHLHTA